MITPGGKLEKMYLLAYDTNEQGATAVSVNGEQKFVFQVNPERYSRRFGVNYTNAGKTPGTMSDPGTYNNTAPETFTVDILFDSSGVIVDQSLFSLAIVNPFSKAQTAEVTDRIELLKNFCYNFQSDPHRPYYIRLCWGDESGFFFGVVTTLEIEYKLFRPDGKPIRAVASLSLQEAEDRILTDRRRGLQSPDITHSRQVKAGDELSYMTYRQYKRSEYYVDVAAANDLLSFRQIPEGTNLFFPPIK